MRYNIISSLDN